MAHFQEYKSGLFFMTHPSLNKNTNVRIISDKQVNVGDTITPSQKHTTYEVTNVSGGSPVSGYEKGSCDYRIDVKPVALIL